jgi:hypothetical protein
LIFDGRFCRMIFEELGGEPSVGMIHVTWIYGWSWKSSLENSRIGTKWLYSTPGWNNCNVNCFLHGNLRPSSCNSPILRLYIDFKANFEMIFF